MHTRIYTKQTKNPFKKMQIGKIYSEIIASPGSCLISTFLISVVFYLLDNLKLWSYMWCIWYVWDFPNIFSQKKKKCLFFLPHFERIYSTRV